MIDDREVLDSAGRGGAVVIGIAAVDRQPPPGSLIGGEDAGGARRRRGTRAHASVRRAVGPVAVHGVDREGVASGMNDVAVVAGGIVWAIERECDRAGGVARSRKCEGVIWQQI